MMVYEIHLRELKYRFYFTLISLAFNIICINFFIEDFFLFFINNFNIQKNIYHEHDILLSENEAINFIIPDTGEAYNFILFITIFIGLILNLPAMFLQILLFKKIGLTVSEYKADVFKYCKIILLIFTFIILFKYYIFELIAADLYNFETYAVNEQVIFQSDPNIEKIFHLMLNIFIQFLIFYYYVKLLLYNVNFYKFIRRRKLIIINFCICLFLFPSNWLIFIIYVSTISGLYETNYALSLVKFGRSRI
jgi:hypothetical protein